MRRRLHFSPIEASPNDPTVQDTAISLFQYHLARAEAADGSSYRPRLDVDALMNGERFLVSGSRDEGVAYNDDNADAAVGERGLRNSNYHRDRCLHLIGDDGPPYAVSREWKALLKENTSNAWISDAYMCDSPRMRRRRGGWI